ncbi:uncharacterized protein LOC144509122 [Mustelus asterias]
MFHSASGLFVGVILAMFMMELTRSRPVRQARQAHHNSHRQEGHPAISNHHPILYIQINDDGHVNMSQHQNDYTLMDIAFTKNGILIKGRKSARYLCSHLNNTLYSTFQLTENCRFKEKHAKFLLTDHGNTKNLNLSPGEVQTRCLQSGEVNLNVADPMGMVEC